MDEIEVARLRRAFRSIRDGYSVTTLDEDKVFIKHLSSLERGDIDCEHVAFYDMAVKKGLLGEKAQLEQLEKDGVWTVEDQRKLEDQEAFIKNLNETKANVLPWQLESINKQIESAVKILDGKKKMRASVLGLTAEEFANRKLNELYICYSFFHDKKFENPLVSREDMEEYDDEELARLVRIYNESMREVSEGMIKRIAITRFFQDLYSLCEKDAHRFYGKAIVDLTYYQCDLAIYGRFFNFILSEDTKPPAEKMDDPDKIIEWYQTTKNAKKELEKNVKSMQDSGGVQQAQTLMGATKKDYKDMGMNVDSSGPSLASLAAKSKDGKLNRQQMLTYLHGQKV